MGANMATRLSHFSLTDSTRVVGRLRAPIKRTCASIARILYASSSGSPVAMPEISKSFCTAIFKAACATHLSALLLLLWPLSCYRIRNYAHGISIVCTMGMRIIIAIMIIMFMLSCWLLFWLLLLLLIYVLPQLLLILRLQCSTCPYTAVGQASTKAFSKL